MPGRFATQKALEMLQSDTNPCDSEGEDINILVEDSETETAESSGKISQTTLSFPDCLVIHFNSESYGG